MPVGVTIVILLTALLTLLGSGLYIALALAGVGIL